MKRDFPITINLPRSATACEAARRIAEALLEMESEVKALASDISVPTDTDIARDLLEERDTELEEARFNASFSWDEKLDRYTLACGCHWRLQSVCDGHVTWKAGMFYDECAEHLDAGDVVRTEGKV